jgi:hypothetical protein
MLQDTKRTALEGVLHFVAGKGYGVFMLPLQSKSFEQIIWPKPPKESVRFATGRRMM